MFTSAQINKEKNLYSYQAGNHCNDSETSVMFISTQ